MSPPLKRANCALILLAAGRSVRLGRPKQLLTFHGRSLLRRAAETSLASVCRPVVVVLGAAAGEVQPELAGLPVTVILNAHWAEGMASSIRAGLAAVEADAVLFLLCDQPLVTAAMLDRIVRLHREQDCGIVASEYEGTLGVPALFVRKYFPELSALKGDHGARQIIVKYRAEVAPIPLPEAASDVDDMQQASQLEAKCPNPAS